MRRMVMIACVVVLSTSVAASAQVVTRNQWRQYFVNNDAYSQGFRAGYAAGIADTSNAAYVNPGVISWNVEQCTQTQTFPTLLQLATVALQQWLAGNNPRVTAAVQVLGAYNTCLVGIERREPNNGGGK
jgi:hypothetical protein